MLQNGDNVILGIDVNEDVQNGKLAKRLKEIGLTMAYRTYFKAQPEFPQWREDFQIRLIEAVAEDTGQTAKQIKA